MRISDWSSDVCSSDLYVQVLRGGLGLFAASDEVTLDDWLRYVDTLQLAQNYPGFKSLSYAPAVADADLPAFVAAVRARPVPAGLVNPALWSAYAPRSPVATASTDRKSTRLNSSH